MCNIYLFLFFFFFFMFCLRFFFGSLFAARNGYTLWYCIQNSNIKIGRCDNSKAFGTNSDYAKIDNGTFEKICGTYEVPGYTKTCIN